MNVLVPDIKSYEQLLHDTMFRLPGITHVRSAIVLKEIKSEMRLALPEQAVARAVRRRGRA
jgi:DNA-binding Lrp family transcriptional regulator